MSNLMPNDGLNAEGYCPKCGMDLGIEGRCYVCALKEDWFWDMFEDVFTCKICGQPKYHSRLYGYLCHNPEHNRDE